MPGEERGECVGQNGEPWFRAAGEKDRVVTESKKERGSEGRKLEAPYGG